MDKKPALLYAQMQEMQQWPLDKKVEKAQEIIRETLKKNMLEALSYGTVLF